MRFTPNIRNKVSAIGCLLRTRAKRSRYQTLRQKSSGLFADSRRASATFALLKTTRKTAAVSSAPPQDLACSFLGWRRASATFALLAATLLPGAKPGLGQTNSSASWSAFPFSATVANDSATGTTANHLAKLNAAGQAVTTAAGDTAGVIGIVVQGAGSAGSPILAAGGQAPCAFDGATVAGDYVQNSASVAGDCHDAGSNYPTTGDVVGRVVTTNQAAGTYMVLVFPGEQKPVIGNAPTATALAATPTTCSVGQNQVATGIQASGNAVCSQLQSAGSTTAGVITTNQVSSLAQSAVSAIPTASAGSSGAGLLAAADWSTFNSKQSSLGIVNVRDYGAAGNGSADDTAKIQSALTAAATAGQVAYFPYGSYLISAPLVVTGSVRCAEGTIIRATASMSAGVQIGSSSVVVTDGFMKGCTVDANNFATDGIFTRQAKHFEFDGTEVLNIVTNGFHNGDPSLASTFVSYEILMDHVHVRRLAGAIVSGSAGIFIDNATDGQVNNSVLVGTDIGLVTKTGGNFFTNIHVWAATGGNMTVGFDDYALGNSYKGCEADTTLTYGYHMRANNFMILGGRVYNNSSQGQDNMMIGIQIDTASAYGTIQGVLFQGADSSHRIAVDVVSNGTGNLVVLGNQDVNVVTANTPGLNVQGQISNTSGGASFTGLTQMFPGIPATATANQASTFRMNGYWWCTSATYCATPNTQQTYAWNINTGQNSSGNLTQPQLYFYMTGTVPYGVTGSLYYGANGATFANNGGTSAGNSSLNHCYQSSYWPASTNTGGAAYDTWCLQNKIGSGTSPLSQFSISHNGSSSYQVNLPVLAIGSDTTYAMSASPRLTWSTYGSCSPQYVPCNESAMWTPSQPIKLLQWTLNLQTAPSGCTTYPVISIRQGSTAIASITLSSGTADYTFAGTLPIAIPIASGALRVAVTTAGAGCSAYGNGVNSTIEYVMQ